MSEITRTIADFHRYAFLATETKPPTETDQNFRLRRVFEELHFFGSLAESRNQGVKIELTNFARNVTRTISQISNRCFGGYSPVNNLPNNVYCFSGAFGHACTAGFTRYISGAKTDAKFADDLDSHLSDLAACAQELAATDELAKEGLTIALDECTRGLRAFTSLYSRKSIQDDAKNDNGYTYLITKLEARISLLQDVKHSLEENTSPAPLTSAEARRLFSCATTQTSSSSSRSFTLDRPTAKPSRSPSAPSLLTQSTTRTSSSTTRAKRPKSSSVSSTSLLQRSPSTPNFQSPIPSLRRSLDTQSTVDTLLTTQPRSTDLKGLDTVIVFPRAPMTHTSAQVKLHIPILRSTSEEDIADFVGKFLHQYIVGKITEANEPKDRPSLMQLLQEQAALLAPISTDALQECALNAYFKTAVYGLYINSRWKDGTQHLQPNSMFHLLFVLGSALAKDFPEIHLAPETIHTRAVATLQIVNDERDLSVQQAMNYETTPRSLSDRRQAILSHLNAKNSGKREEEQSWFLDYDQSWFRLNEQQLISTDPKLDRSKLPFEHDQALLKINRERE